MAPFGSVLLNVTSKTRIVYRGVDMQKAATKFRMIDLVGILAYAVASLFQE